MGLIDNLKVYLKRQDCEGVESMLSLRPYHNGVRESSTSWNEFCVFSVSEEAVGVSIVTDLSPWNTKRKQRR